MAAAVLSSLTLLCRLPRCAQSLQTSDSVDYLRAVRSGLPAHYLDSGSVGFTGAVRLYLGRPEIRDRM